MGKCIIAQERSPNSSESVERNKFIKKEIIYKISKQKMHDTKCTVHFYLTYSALLTFRNCSYWTLSSTSATIYTSVSIDLIMICSLSDSSYWTFSFARSAAYTFITNYVCHSMYPPLRLNILDIIQFVVSAPIIIQKIKINKGIECFFRNT